MNKDPEDIDILTTKKGLGEFYKYYPGKKEYKGVGGRNVWQQIITKINGIEVSIMTEEILPKSQQLFKEGFLEGGRLMNLDKQLLGMERVLKRKGENSKHDRAKKIKILKDFLKNKNKS